MEFAGVMLMIRGYRPFISSAIIDDAGGNNNMAFAFLLALGTLSMGILWLVDVPKARKECNAFVLAEEKRGAFVQQQHKI